MGKPIKKFLVITSIFPPTEAIKKFSQLPGWRLIVVGDKKTPHNWRYPNVTYLSPEDQQHLGLTITRYLPWNHYGRKMVGYLYAIKEGAEVIYDTDDDNIPLRNWYEPEFSGSYDTLSGIPFLNTYRYFTDKNVWPRGLPLRELRNTNKVTGRKRENTVQIWQFLANNDPDVDAIYRFVDNTPVTFKNRRPLVLEKGTIAPINTQNTFFHKDAFLLLFLPAFVSFRFTDILRGFVAQPILWTQQARAGFGQATVIQNRNPHDYLKDFSSEVPMYLHTEKVVEIAKKTVDPKLSYAQNLMKVYKELQKADVVTKEEIVLLKAWCADVKKYLK
jgi:hypothetical protein